MEFCQGIPQLVQLSDYIPFIDEDCDDIDFCSASQVPKSSNSTTLLRKQINTDERNRNGGFLNNDKAKNCLNKETGNWDSEISMTTSTISSHSSLQRPSKDYGSKLSAFSSSSQCQDDSSVVWLGRYPNSYIAGPIGSCQGVSATCAYPTCGYELSDDFQQKQIEMLERKYGGHYRSHRAATVIQRAFRDYCLAKKWKQGIILTKLAFNPMYP